MRQTLPDSTGSLYPGSETVTEADPQQKQQWYDIWLLKLFYPTLSFRGQVECMVGIGQQ